jgi:hypothetical protein
MTMRPLMPILLLLMMVGGCITTPPARTASHTAGAQPPDWIGGSSSRYPATRYLSGIGQSEEAEGARQRARADLARTFEVRIVEQIRDTTRVSQQQTGERSETVDREISRTIASFTDQMLEGVAISEMWHNNGQFYALATLERSQAAARLSSEITRLDQRITLALATNANHRDPLAALSPLQQAIGDQHERNRLNRMLAIVADEGATLAPRHDLDQMTQQRQQQMAALTFAIAVTGDDPGGQIASAIASAIEHDGLRHQSQGALYQLRGELQRETLLQEGWHWQRGQLQLELRQGSRILGRKSFSFRASATSASVAKQRANDQLASQLRQELATAIIDFANGQTPPDAP